MSVRFVQSPDAVRTTKVAARPGLVPAARAIVAVAPTKVPVHRGVQRRLYSVTPQEGDDEIRIFLGSPFWHWLEYGTRWNPPYRVAENTVRSLGLRWEPH